jgi:hypothetical protein
MKNKLSLNPPLLGTYISQGTEKSVGDFKGSPKIGRFLAVFLKPRNLSNYFVS